MLTYKFLSIFPQDLFHSFERIFIEFYFSPFHNLCFCADTSCLNVQLCAHFYPLCFSAPQTFSQVCTPSPLHSPPLLLHSILFFPLRFLECTILHENICFGYTADHLEVLVTKNFIEKLMIIEPLPLYPTIPARCTPPP